MTEEAYAARLKRPQRHVAGESDITLAEPHLWRLVIPGEPVAKGRPKLGTVAGHAMAFTPAKTRRYEDIVRQLATVNWAGRKLLADRSITLVVKFYHKIPKSWSKRHHESAMLGLKKPLGRPDLDNCVKSITDGLNGVIYVDDSAICRIDAEKRYSVEPRVELELTW